MPDETFDWRAAGRTLRRSARNLHAAAEDLDALWHQIRQGFADQVGEVRFSLSDEDAMGSWARVAQSATFRVHRRAPSGKGKPAWIGDLTVALWLHDDAAGEEARWGGADQPQLLVGFADGAWALDHMRLDADGGGESLVRRSTHLWGWDGANEAWMFALPLTALTDATLDEQVVRPAVILLRHGADPADAFPQGSVAFRVPEGVPAP